MVDPEDQDWAALLYGFVFPFSANTQKLRFHVLLIQKILSG